MIQPAELDNLIDTLPDPESARRFYRELSDADPRTGRISEAVLSDLLTLSAYSPLLATTILQNRDYIQWLSRERTDTKVRSKETLLESLSRFSLLHTDVSSNIMLARFRRRELLRIFLRDIRRLATIAEITEELSNLADVIIEFALRLAKQDLENRFGVPLEIADRGRSSPAGFCVIALGKLGSKELNYSSDIDLLFVYSNEGMTSDTGSSGSITNREYFIKLAEKMISLAGGQSGEGAAYRIDMRLRPHGSIGRLALSLEETVRYYRNDAREWEQQVLIRSRAIAGDLSLFRKFYSEVEDRIFRPDTDVVRCLANVRQSKRRIEDPVPPGPGYNVKLGRGGIREIEFISQALQLAYGGRDKWLRHPHTLVSLSRLADRNLIPEKQLTGLFEAYEFLRRTEHLLQMEHGLQTHFIPKADHELLARRAGFSNPDEFDAETERHSRNVQEVFTSVFADVTDADLTDQTETPICGSGDLQPTARQSEYERIASISVPFAQLFASVPDGPLDADDDLSNIFLETINSKADFGGRLSVLRQTWRRLLLGIGLREIRAEISIAESKQLQTSLAEASIDAALDLVRGEIALRYSIDDLPLDVLALGKLGGQGVDYQSDLDIVLVYPDDPLTESSRVGEIYNRAVEIFVNTLSGMTRDGSLYRVDLRLRPYGNNGASANPRSVFLDYFKNTAAVWELLAFVKLRGVTSTIATDIETEVRTIIHERARMIAAGELKSETLRIRQLLEKQKAARRRQVDIKYGSGGMLDVYFAARYLQLRDNVPDRVEDRSTIAVLNMLWENRSLSEADFESLSAGYAFLSELDHNIRLTTARSRQIPTSVETQNNIARRMNISDPEKLLETLNLHRINVRRSFEHVLGS